MLYIHMYICNPYTCLFLSHSVTEHSEHLLNTQASSALP